MAIRTLPLHCNICPKKPDFSDTSHLLTHIASKSHLSHYYKSKVRSSTEQASKDAIEIYDAWYADWNVEKLMSERMHLKDRKRRNLPTTHARSKTKRKDQYSLDVFDPELTMPVDSQPNLSNETEQKLDSSIYSLPSLFSLPKPKRPRLHLWSTFQSASFRALPLEPSSPFINTKTTDDVFASHISAFTPTDGEPADDADMTDRVSEATKLKGIFWPGMDIFDAAPDDMRRKRNQKKALSVVERLEHNSLLIEPIEQVFTPFGSLRKQKVISGKADPNSSPIKAERTPSKRAASARTALAERNLNVPALGQGRRQATSTNRSRASAYGASGYTPDTKSRQRRSFSVYNDCYDQPFGNPIGMKCLTSTFQYEDTVRPEVSDYAPFAPDTRYEYGDQLSFFQGNYSSYQSHADLPYLENHDHPVNHDFLSFDFAACFQGNEEAMGNHQASQPDKDDGNYMTT